MTGHRTPARPCAVFAALGVCSAATAVAETAYHWFSGAQCTSDGPSVVIGAGTRENRAPMPSLPLRNGQTDTVIFDCPVSHALPPVHPGGSLTIRVWLAANQRTDKFGSCVVRTSRAGYPVFDSASFQLGGWSGNEGMWHSASVQFPGFVLGSLGPPPINVHLRCTLTNSSGPPYSGVHAYEVSYPL